MDLSKSGSKFIKKKYLPGPKLEGIVQQPAGPSIQGIPGPRAELALQGKSEGLQGVQHPVSLAISSVQLLSCVWLFATPWTAASQASLSIAIGHDVGLFQESFKGLNFMCLTGKMQSLPEQSHMESLLLGKCHKEHRWPVCWLSWRGCRVSLAEHMLQASVTSIPCPQLEIIPALTETNPGLSVMSWNSTCGEGVFQAKAAHSRHLMYLGVKISMCFLSVFKEVHSL